MGVLVARFFRHMISENVQLFWAALQRGEFITDAAEGHCQLEQSEGDFRRFASAIHQVACDV